MVSVEKGKGVSEWWWMGAGTGQLGLGIVMVRRGHSGNATSQLMPLKAFGVASLFVGAIASASLSLLRSYGIYSVEDMKEAGRNIRSGIGIPPRPRAQDN